MPGIVTVTMAPAIDLTYRVGAVLPGAVNRATAVTRELSGKGVNVSHAVALAGERTRAVLPLGEHDSADLRAPWLSPVPTAQRVRINVTMATADGLTTKLNAPTPTLTPDELDAVLARAVDDSAELDADWLLIAGSVPRLSTGSEISIGEVIERLADRTTARIAVDTSGSALELVLTEALPRVALIKPNTHELAEATGRSLTSLGDVREAAAALVARGCETVYVSMGEDGALAVTADGSWWAHATPPGIVNTTGAGDASLAGFLVAGSPDRSESWRGPRSPERAAAARAAGIPRSAHSGGAFEPGNPLPFDTAAAVTGAARLGALSVSQAGTLLTELESAPPATLVVDPDPGIRLADPAE